MPPTVRVVATHVKVRYRDQIIRQLCALQLPQVEIGECEKDYEFLRGGWSGGDERNSKIVRVHRQTHPAIQPRSLVLGSRRHRRRRFQ
jgi:hypothetical protein